LTVTAGPFMVIVAPCPLLIVMPASDTEISAPADDLAMSAHLPRQETLGYICPREARLLGSSH
jgi:hypothetical protein